MLSIETCKLVHEGYNKILGVFEVLLSIFRWKILNKNVCLHFHLFSLSKRANVRKKRFLSSSFYPLKTKSFTILI